eukprot:TRINITY_DN18185_c0_g2_i3.p1 TRINITY_DN18185_c0_g2~~TRINITY_DN18185_c0_g2_i3.p1  ORF type:complete len:435 (-),score=123.20 TRINITY_DN18185_c0_g2_i3:420-1646(-)
MSFVGTIKSFRPEKGFGFIECAQTSQMYGKDMFVLKTALPTGEANKGDQVRFDVTQEHNGPVASNVSFVSRVAAAPQMGGGGGAYGGGNAYGMQGGGCGGCGGCGGGYGGCGGGYGGCGGGAPGGMFMGVVKSFNQEKGWGLVECPQTHQMYGKDIFFGKNVVPDGGYISVGEQVQFSIKQEEKGPAVAQMQKMGYGGMGGYGGCGGGGGNYGGGMMGGGCGGGCMGSNEIQGSGSKRDQPFFGVLKTWNAEKGWGHISCEASNKIYGKDIFLLKGLLQGQSVDQGSLVSFKVQLSQKGPQAATVNILPPGSFKTEGSGDGTFFTGTLKRYSEERGFGFLEGDDLKHIFGKDIFLHRRELEGQSLSDGAQVQFTVELDSQGQPAAKNCSIGGYGAVGVAPGGARASPY